MRVERVDPQHVALISSAGEAMILPNVEFTVMCNRIRGGDFPVDAKPPTRPGRSSSARSGP